MWEGVKDVNTSKGQMAEAKWLPEMSFGTFSPDRRGGWKRRVDFSQALKGACCSLSPPLSSLYVYVSALGGCAAVVSDKGRVSNMTRTGCSLSLRGLYCSTLGSTWRALCRGIVRSLAPPSLLSPHDLI